MLFAQPILTGMGFTGRFAKTRWCWRIWCWGSRVQCVLQASKNQPQIYIDCTTSLAPEDQGLLHASTVQFRCDEASTDRGPHGPTGCSSLRRRAATCRPVSLPWQGNSAIVFMIFSELIFRRMHVSFMVMMRFWVVWYGYSVRGLPNY